MNALRIVCIVLGALVVGSPARAQNAAPSSGFYQGRTIELIVSDAVGGGSDMMARLVGRYIGRHIPGHPGIVVKNVPGAGGLAGANNIYNLAPRDGSAIGMVEQSIHLSQLFKASGLHADSTKFNWLGRIISNNAVLFAWHSAKVKKIGDAFNEELVVSAPGASSVMRWSMLKKLTGVKFKLIVGHKGTSEASLAMERGEVDGLSIPWVVFRGARADWLRDRKVNLLLQTGLDRASDLPDLPRVVDLARNDEQRQLLEMFSLSEKIGRSLLTPPGVPAERVAELRAAFAASMRDPDLLAEVKALKLELDPLPGEELQTLIANSFNYPPDLVAKAEALSRQD